MGPKGKIKIIMARNVTDETIAEPYIATKRKVTYWFNILNKEIFDGELTNFRNIHIKDNLQYKKGKIFAECEGCYTNNKQPIADLYLTTNFKNIQQFLSVMAHEMIHLYQWIFEGSMNHNKISFLQPWLDKLKKHGIKLTVYY